MDSKAEEKEHLYTTKEIADGLGVSEATIRRAIRKKQLNAEKLPDNKKSYFVSLSSLELFGLMYSKRPLLKRINRFVDDERKAIARARAEVALTKELSTAEELPVWMKRKEEQKSPTELEDSNIVTATPQQPTESTSSSIESMEWKKSDNLIELYNSNDSDLYTLMKGTKLKINLINFLVKASKDERKKYEEIKEVIPKKQPSSEKERRIIDYKIQKLDLEIIENKKKLAVEIFNLENCRLKDKNHEIEKRIDAEMAASSADGTPDISVK